MLKFIGRLFEPKISPRIIRELAEIHDTTSFDNYRGVLGRRLRNRKITWTEARESLLQTQVIDGQHRVVDAKPTLIEESSSEG
jgi:hypothetical protein